MLVTNGFADWSLWPRDAAQTKDSPFSLELIQLPGSVHLKNSY